MNLQEDGSQTIGVVWFEENDTTVHVAWGESV